MARHDRRPKREQAPPEPPDDELDEAVWESFPASDPPAPAVPDRAEPPPEHERDRKHRDREDD